MDEPEEIDLDIPENEREDQDTFSEYLFPFFPIDYFKFISFW
jgi:hypothetical protein